MGTYNYFVPATIPVIDLNSAHVCSVVPKKTYHEPVISIRRIDTHSIHCFLHEIYRRRNGS